VSTTFLLFVCKLVSFAFSFSFSFSPFVVSLLNYPMILLLSSFIAFYHHMSLVCCSGIGISAFSVPDMVPRFLDHDKVQLRFTFPINITFASTHFSSSFIKIIPRFHFHLVDATSIGHSRFGASSSKSHSGITK